MDPLDTQENTYTVHFFKCIVILFSEPKKGVLGKPHINYISFAAPPSPLLSQFEDIPEDAFCDDKCKQGNSSTLCVCAIAYNVKLNSVVDLILTDRGKVSFKIGKVRYHCSLTSTTCLTIIIRW